jgi:hypothetical protein
MSLKVQETPQAPSYAAAPIQVPANIATPQATMANVKSLQGELNAVNNLTGGRRRGTSGRRSRRTLKHKSFIRTYKGRRYVSKGQTGGSSAASSGGGQIAVPLVGPLCSSGTQCAGVQNANLTSLYNQAQSNGLNDQLAITGGGSSRGRRSNRRYKKVTFRRHRQSSRRHDDTPTIAYNIKKIIRKIFT